MQFCFIYLKVVCSHAFNRLGKYEINQMPDLLYVVIQVQQLTVEKILLIDSDNARLKVIKARMAAGHQKKKFKRL